MTVRVVTDSTADLPSDLVHSLGITVVPLSVNFGNHTYLDGVDLDADGFYHRLEHSDFLPTTSQPSTGSFAQAYTSLADETDQIISIHISPKLSATLNSAQRGREAMDASCQVEIIDSNQTSMGLGLVVMRAAMAAQAGADLNQVLDVTREVIPQTRVFAMVNTLEYLHKGGRIGKAKALMGGLLSIKPLIGLRDGEIHAIGKERTRKKALVRLIKMIQEFRSIEEIAILHSTLPYEAATFTESISAILDEGRIYQSRIGPVIGTHLGPGSMGIAVIGESP